ncbi:MAG TPA: hypothetical protein VFG19_16525 [Geobacteraceae bacterium]|nr:hypothetical protein [Geobacteraceae bacterium]
MFFLQSAALLAAVTLISFFPLRHLIDFLLGKNYFSGHMWPKGVFLLIAGILVWAIGRRYNRATRENKSAPVRTFLFVRFEYWGIAFAIVAVFMILLGCAH